jgi:DNA-binding NarL/FixJ family response regulator
MDQPGISMQQSHALEAANRARVTIISDVLIYREGLAATLARDGRLRVLGLADSADALARICTDGPDVVLVDGAMPDCLGLARRIRANFPGLRVVGFGIAGGADRLVDCAESGLAAFVGCDSSVTELVSAVLCAIKGEVACSPQVTALLCERLERLSFVRSHQPRQLTGREREIAMLIGKGLSNKEIANVLMIGASTVKNHVHSILEKLKVRRRSAIVHQLREFPWMHQADRNASGSGSEDHTSVPSAARPQAPRIMQDRPA